MKKERLKKLRKKTDKELNDLYMQYNTVISLFKAQNCGQLRHVQKKEGTMKTYHEAKQSRAVILTILNQRRHERMWRDGNAEGVKT